MILRESLFCVLWMQDNILFLQKNSKSMMLEKLMTEDYCMTLPGSSWVESVEGRLRGRVKLTVGVVFSSFRSAKFGDEVHDEAAWLNLPLQQKIYVILMLLYVFKKQQTCLSWFLTFNNLAGCADAIKCFLFPIYLPIQVLKCLQKLSNP